MEFIWYIVLGFAIILVVAVITEGLKKKRINEMKNVIMNMPINHNFISRDGVNAIAINDSSSYLYLIKRVGGRIIQKKYDFKDIIGAEIIENGESVTKVSRGSQIGRAVAGGVLLGGVGAVIGGLTAKTKSHEKIKSLVLEIIVSDMSNPIERMHIINSPVDKNGADYQMAFNDARCALGIIKVIVNRNETIS